jgi:hypothetical protein
MSLFFALALSPLATTLLVTVLLALTLGGHDSLAFIVAAGLVVGYVVELLIFLPLYQWVRQSRKSRAWGATALGTVAGGAASMLLVVGTGWSWRHWGDDDGFVFDPITPMIYILPFAGAVGGAFFHLFLALYFKSRAREAPAPQE